MDNFINLAKQGYQAYEESQNQGQGQQQGAYQNQGQQQQGNYQGGQQGGGYQDNQGQGQGQGNVQGGAQWNSPDHQNVANDQNAQIDQHQVAQQASSFAGNSGDSGLFAQAMSFISNNKQEHTQPVDEQAVQQAHNEAYNNGNAGSMDSQSMGAAAAMQAFKAFTSGQSGGSGSSGSSQTQILSLAMSEGAKLFDQSGGGNGADKNSVIQSAGMTVMKLLVQSKFSGMMGGSNSGGLSSLMGMASKFM